MRCPVWTVVSGYPRPKFSVLLSCLQDTGCQPLSTVQRKYLKSWWSVGIINLKTAPSSVNFRKSSRSSRRRSRSDGAAWTRPLLPQSNTVLLVNHECIPCCVQPSSKVTFFINCFFKYVLFKEKKKKKAKALKRSPCMGAPSSAPREWTGSGSSVPEPARPALTGRYGAPQGRFPPGPAPRCRPGCGPRSVRACATRHAVSARHVPTKVSFLRRQGRSMMVNITSHRTVQTSPGSSLLSRQK